MGAPGGAFSEIRVAANKDGRLELFGIGADHALWHRWQTGSVGNSWSGWYSLGGWVSDISVTRNADGRLEVDALGGSGTTWTNYQVSPGGNWSDWVSTGGIAQPGLITQALNADGRLEVFVIGTDGQLYHRRQAAASSSGIWDGGWSSLGGGNV
jgi:hypothetical protein